MRICFVCCEYPPSRHGGIGTIVQTLARALVQNGHAVRVVGTYDEGDPASDFEEDRGVQVWRQRRRGRSNWLKARYELFRTIQSWARAGDIDLVEVPDYAGQAALWPRLPVPVIVRLNGSGTYFASEMGWKIDLTMKLAERWSLRRADFCCSASHYTAERTAGAVGIRFRVDAVLHNAVESFLDVCSSHKDRWKVFFSGTLTPKKGIVSLIDAWPGVQKACPEAELHVCGGDGRMDNGQPVSSYLNAKLRPWLGRTVHYYGFVPRERMLQMLGTSRVAVFPSLSEAFALAPMEAMALGCATIYTTLTSGPELIEHGRTGLLVDPRQPEQILNAIVRLLKNHSLSDRLSREGREHVQTYFSLPVMTAKNTEFYRACVNEFRTRTSAAFYPHACNTDRTSESSLR